MAKKEFIKQKIYFSESIKKQTVADIEKGKASVLQASRELNVAEQTIYNWIYRYSRHLQKNKILVVEEKSESYRTKQLEDRVKDLEAALGRKQLEVELLNKIIEVAGEEYKADIKKNFSKQRFNGSAPTKQQKEEGTP
jgi:transposase-like protein